MSTWQDESSELSASDAFAAAKSLSPKAHVTPSVADAHASPVAVAVSVKQKTRRAAPTPNNWLGVSSSTEDEDEDEETIKHNELPLDKLKEVRERTSVSSDAGSTAWPTLDDVRHTSYEIESLGASAYTTRARAVVAAPIVKLSGKHFVRQCAESLRYAVSVLQPLSKRPDAFGKQFVSTRSVQALLRNAHALESGETLHERSNDVFDLERVRALAPHKLTTAKLALCSAFPTIGLAFTNFSFGLSTDEAERARLDSEADADAGAGGSANLFSREMAVHSKAVMRYAVGEYRLTPSMKDEAVDELDDSARFMADYLAEQRLVEESKRQQVESAFTDHNRATIDYVEQEMQGKRRIVSPGLGDYYTRQARALGSGSCDDPLVNGNSAFIGAPAAVHSAADAANERVIAVLASAMGDEREARDEWQRHVRLEREAIDTLVREGESADFDRARDRYVSASARGGALVDVQTGAWLQRNVSLEDDLMYPPPPDPDELRFDGDEEVEVSHFHHHHHHFFTEVPPPAPDEVFLDERDDNGCPPPLSSLGLGQDDANDSDWCDEPQLDEDVCAASVDDLPRLRQSLAAFAVKLCASRPSARVQQKPPPTPTPPLSVDASFGSSDIEFDPKPLQDALFRFVSAQAKDDERTVMAASVAVGAQLLARLRRDGDDVQVFATLVTKMYESLADVVALDGRLDVLRDIAANFERVAGQAAAAAGAATLATAHSQQRFVHAMSKMRKDFLVVHASLEPKASGIERVADNLVAELAQQIMAGPWAASASGKLRDVRRYAPFYLRTEIRFPETLSAVLNGLVSSVLATLPMLEEGDRFSIVAHWSEAAKRVRAVADRELRGPSVPSRRTTPEDAEDAEEPEELDEPEPEEQEESEPEQTPELEQEPEQETEPEPEPEPEQEPAPEPEPEQQTVEPATPPVQQKVRMYIRGKPVYVTAPDDDDDDEYVDVRFY